MTAAAGATWSPGWTARCCRVPSEVSKKRAWSFIGGVEVNRLNASVDAVPESNEFILYAVRNAIHRYDLATGTDQPLPLNGLREAVALDFDYDRNCLYWADISLDTIQVSEAPPPIPGGSALLSEPASVSSAAAVPERQHGSGGGCQEGPAERGGALLRPREQAAVLGRRRRAEDRGNALKTVAAATEGPDL